MLMEKALEFRIMKFLFNREWPLMRMRRIDRRHTNLVNNWLVWVSNPDSLGLSKFLSTDQTNPSYGTNFLIFTGGRNTSALQHHNVGSKRTTTRSSLRVFKCKAGRFI